MDASSYATLQDAILRIVVPVRREFGVKLDVPRMRHDIDYAQFAVTLALASGSAEVHERAEYMQLCIRAARQQGVAGERARGAASRRGT